MTKAILPFVLLLFSVQLTMSQTDMEGIISNYFIELQKTSDYEADDLKEWKITRKASSLNPKINYVYVLQHYNDIPITNAHGVLTFENGEIIKSSLRFYKNLKKQIKNSSIELDEKRAIMHSVNLHKLVIPVLERKSKEQGKIQFIDTNSNYSLIEAQKMFLMHEETFKLVWKTRLILKGGKVSWHDVIEAESGKILKSYDGTISCSFGTVCEDDKESSLQKHNYSTTRNKYQNNPISESMYYVFKSPVESPDHGGQSNVDNPHDLVASPLGWHHIDGSPEEYFFYTRGNNAWVKFDEDGNDNGDQIVDGPGDSANSSETSGSSISFPYGFSESLGFLNAENVNASMVNAFYWVNLAHDVSYRYGFDETSGNFQESHYTTDQTNAGDFVYVDILDGWSPAPAPAAYTSMPDGENPLITFYNMDNGRNFALDNLVMVHEYAHGMSTRMVGWAEDIPTMMEQQEQMGEGWSDWFGLMLTMNMNDADPSRRTVGTYFMDLEIDDPTGIRQSPYSPDMTINNFTYDMLDDIYGSNNNGGGPPHDVGFAWATILWDLTWALIDVHGFSSDLHTGSGGNNIAMKLILEGMKKTLPGDGFVKARDAILEIDETLFNGQYYCLIYDVFARRGVGFSASEGSGMVVGDEIAAFDMPCDIEDCPATVSPPYSEAFENTFGLWVSSANNDIEWINHNGLDGEGPNSGNGTLSDWYMYVNDSITPESQLAILNSPCIDLTNAEVFYFSFDYHQNGVDRTGLFVVEVSNNDGLSYTEVWVSNSDLSDSWITQELDLNAYLGQEIRIRFRRETAPGGNVDIAIDNININQTQDGGCMQSNMEITSGTLDCEVLGDTFEAQICGTFCEAPGQIFINMKLAIIDTVSGDELEIPSINPIINGDEFCFTITDEFFPNTTEGNYTFHISAEFDTGNEPLFVNDQIFGVSFDPCSPEDPCDGLMNIQLNDSIITWDDIGGTYYLQVITNAENCCDSNEEPDFYTFTVNENTFDLKTIIDKTGEKCFKFRVYTRECLESTWCCIQYDGDYTMECGLEKVVNSISNNITIFPNPTKDAVTVSSRKIPLESLEIFNMQGISLLNRKAIHDINETMIVRQLKSGMYIIVITLVDGTTMTKNLIVK